MRRVWEAPTTPASNNLFPFLVLGLGYPLRKALKRPQALRLDAFYDLSSRGQILNLLGYLANFQFAFMEVALKHPTLGSATSQECCELRGIGTLCIGRLDFLIKGIFKQANRRQFL